MDDAAQEIFCGEFIGRWAPYGATSRLRCPLTVLTGTVTVIALRGRSFAGQGLRYTVMLCGAIHDIDCNGSRLCENSKFCEIR